MRSGDSIGGGILLYVIDHIPANLLSIETKPVEGFYIELNLRKKILLTTFIKTR